MLTWSLVKTLLPHWRFPHCNCSYVGGCWHTRWYKGLTQVRKAPGKLCAFSSLPFPRQWMCSSQLLILKSGGSFYHFGLGEWRLSLVHLSLTLKVIFLNHAPPSSESSKEFYWLQSKTPSWMVWWFAHCVDMPESIPANLDGLGPSLTEVRWADQEVHWTQDRWGLTFCYKKQCCLK